MGRAGALLFVLSVLAPRVAAAQPYSISVPDGDGCLDAARLSDLVQGHARSSAVDPLLRFVVERDRPTSAIAFTVRRDGAVVSVRRFDAPPADCGATHAMLAIAIAMALDAASAQSSTDAPQSRRPPVQLRAVRPAPPKARAEATVALAGLFGVAREFSFGGTLSIHVVLAEGLDARLGALASLPTDSRLGGGAVEVSLGAARIDLCPARPVGRLRGRLCAGALVGRAFGVGRGFETPFSASALWVAVSGRVSLVAPLTRRLGIDAGVDLLVPLVRPVFVVLDRGGEEAASVAVPAWGVLVSVGPALSFP